MDQENMPAAPTPVAQAQMVAKMPGFGTLFSSAMELYQNHFMLLASIFLVPTVINFVISFFMPRGTTFSFGPLEIVLLIVTVVISIIGQIALFSAISDPAKFTFGSALNAGVKRFLPYLWLAIVSAVISVGMFGLFVIPGILFSIWFSMSMFTFIVEDERGMNSLLKSIHYTWGHWWGILGRLLLVGIIVALIYIVIMFVGGLIAWGAFASGSAMGSVVIGIVAIIVSLFVTPFTYIFMFKMYEGLKQIAPAGEVDKSSGRKAKFLIPAIIGLVLAGIYMSTVYSGIKNAQQNQFMTQPYGSNFPQSLDQNSLKSVGQDTLINNLENSDAPVPTGLPADIPPAPQR